MDGVRNSKCRLQSSCIFSSKEYDPNKVRRNHQKHISLDVRDGCAGVFSCVEGLPVVPDCLDGGAEGLPLRQGCSGVSKGLPGGLKLVIQAHHKGLKGNGSLVFMQIDKLNKNRLSSNTCGEDFLWDWLSLKGISLDDSPKGRPKKQPNQSDYTFLAFLTFKMTLKF